MIYNRVSLITTGYKMKTPPYNSKYDELATFNSDPDKSKYTTAYLIKMDNLQTEYDIEQIDWANKNGWLVF